MRRSKRRHLLDFIIFIIFTAVLAESFIHIYGERKASSTLIITAPDGEYVYDMSEEREVLIRGALGDSKIVISEGGAFFADSPCPNKNCVSAGKVSRGGQWAACLPNDVFIRVEGAQSSDAESF